MTKTLTATSPDGLQTVTYTGNRKGVAWATWMFRAQDVEWPGWSHLGWSTAPDLKKAVSAAKATNRYADQHMATPTDAPVA